MWRTAEHTADVALEVGAATWEELLAEAARAFGEWTSGGRLPAEPHETERSVEVNGTDRVDAWVRFWRALLRLWTVEGFLPLHARVAAPGDGLQVHARVGCVSAGALDPAHCADIKAVTWHEARAEPRDPGWFGRIVLDL